MLPLDAAAHTNFKADSAPSFPIAQPHVNIAGIVQAIKQEFEPRFAALEQRLETISSSTKQELKGMFDELKTFLVPSAQPPLPQSGVAPSPALSVKSTTAVAVQSVHHGELLYIAANLCLQFLQKIQQKACIMILHIKLKTLLGL